MAAAEATAATRLHTRSIVRSKTKSGQWLLFPSKPQPIANRGVTTALCTAPRRRRGGERPPALSCGITSDWKLSTSFPAHASIGCRTRAETDGVVCMGLALEADNLPRCPVRGIALPSGGEVTLAPGVKPPDRDENR